MQKGGINILYRFKNTNLIAVVLKFGKLVKPSDFGRAFLACNIANPVISADQRLQIRFSKKEKRKSKCKRKFHSVHKRICELI